MSSKQFRISIIGSRGYPYVYSGYETLVKEISERFSSNGIEVTIYCHKHLFKKRPSIIFPLVTKTDLEIKKIVPIKLVYLPSIPTKSLSQITHSILAFIHAGFSRTDALVVVNASNGPLGLIAKLFGKPCLINVDGLEWMRPKWKGIGAFYFKWAAKMSTKLYDKVITDAEAMRQIYLTEFGKDTTVIAYGATKRESQNPSLIQKWGLESNKYYLIVGRLIPDNNADIIINGFLNSQTKLKLVVVGDVPYKDKYADQIKSIQDPRLLFTGYVNDSNELAELYHHCFVYFHGHEFGGTNPTLLKAMAYGAAVAALDTPFSREVLQNEIFGFYFTKDPKSIVAFIENAESQMIDIQGRKSQIRAGISANYHWDTVASLYLSAIKEIISKKKM